LKPSQKKMLRARAHALKPVVITGQAGLTPAILDEISRALDHHELIKVRVNADDRNQRRDITTRICHELSAELVQSLGHIITLFRTNPDKPS